MCCCLVISSPYRSDNLSIVPIKVPYPCNSPVRAYRAQSFIQLVSYRNSLVSGVLYQRHCSPTLMVYQCYGLNLMRQLLHFCGYDTSAFKGHSFRIGAAAAAASRGDSDAQIWTAGRWTSDALKNILDSLKL